MTPPSTARIVYLIARLSARRFTNRIAALRAKRPSPGQRSAIARKPATGRALLAFLGLIFVFQTVTATTRLVQQAAQYVERNDGGQGVLIDEASWWRLHTAPPGELSAEVDALVERESSALDNESEREAREQQLRRAFQEHGLEGFRQSELPLIAFWPDTELWYSAADPLAMLRPLALVAFLLSVAQVLQHVAGSDDDLARVSASLEWLFTFPVRARSLFLARALAAVFTGPLLWVLVCPFYAVVFWCSGYGALGIPLAVLAALYVALLGGGLRVLLESSLRRYLPLVWVSRVQAALLTLSAVAMLGGVAVAYARQSLWVFEWTARLPEAAFFLPPCLPAWLVVGGQPALGAALGSGLFISGWLAFSIWSAEQMVRAGISSGSGPYLARRGQAAELAAGAQGFALGALVQKELRALFRDRRLRTQAFVTPCLVFGLQFWINPRLLHDISGNPRHIATAAFAVSAFALTTGACNALATEGSALWMLYTLPERLERLLLEKLWVWLGVAYLFAGGFLALVWARVPQLILPSLPYAVFAMAGVYIYGVIALGIGSLGTDPLEAEPRRRIRPGSLYLFMSLAGLFAYAIYAPSLWTKFVQLILSGLLAFALWQKLRDHLPYLLDPTEAPAPQIAVADGVIAALGFFVLQGVFVLFFADDDGAQGRALLLGFSTAGIAVTALSLFAFRRSGVPRLWRVLGLSRPAGSRSRVLPVGLGIGGGILAGLLGIGYRLLAQHVPWLAELFEQGSSLLPEEEQGLPWWFIALTLLAAPVFEEFIFRGILYRGLRRSLRAPLAVLASALVFALVHPVVAAFPVFVMALVAAAAYERTGWLATPIAVHVTYNAMVLASAFL
ncbi:MAG TPA: CPBP family intramembrane glutamic endopeptidase [Polyangiaceae bacterium]|nr:CPBP family intramembrane glutamic endopeptidase [Polyangiaceae bacterium]